MIHLKRIFILIFMAVLTLAPELYCYYNPMYSPEQIEPCYLFREKLELAAVGMYELDIMGRIYIVLIGVVLFLYLLCLVWKNHKAEIALKTGSLLLTGITIARFGYTFAEKKEHYGEMGIDFEMDWRYADTIHFLELVLAVALLIDIWRGIRRKGNAEKKYYLCLYYVYVVLLYLGVSFGFSTIVMDHAEMGESLSFYNIFSGEGTNMSCLWDHIQYCYRSDKAWFMEYIRSMLTVAGIMTVAIILVFVLKSRGRYLLYFIHKILNVITVMVFGYTMYLCWFSESEKVAGRMFFPIEEVALCMALGGIILLLNTRWKKEDL